MGNVGEASLSKGVNTGTEREQPQKLSCARLSGIASVRDQPWAGHPPSAFPVLGHFSTMTSL